MKMLGRGHLLRLTTRVLILALIVYLGLAYFLVPLGWRRLSRHHPALDNAPRISYTANDIPGDPINVGLVATEEELVKAMLATDWHPADRITLRSSFRIARDGVFRRAYVDAPVSSLYVFGRKQDTRPSVTR